MTDDTEQPEPPKEKALYSDSKGDMFVFDPEQLEKDVLRLTALLVSRQEDVKDGAGVALYVLAQDSGKEYTRYVAGLVGARYARHMIEVATYGEMPFFQQNFARFIFAFRHLFGATEIPDPQAPDTP